MPAANTHVAEEKDKPVFDEHALARLLEAAYVLQEHNRELRQREVHLEIQRDQLGAQERAASATQVVASQPASAPAQKDETDYTQTLAQIVETQRQIQARNLQLQAVLDLVTERVMEIAKAGGAAIGILAGKSIRYSAMAGSMTPPRGVEIAMEKALCVASLRTGQVIRCTDVSAEFLLDVEECQRRAIHSMIAVPIYHDGGIAGGLEIYYATPQAFTEQDVHTCQLMAGLVTEALVREEELAAQKSISNQRAAMREAVEKIKPTVAAIADRTASQTAGPMSSGKTFICRKCGHELVGEEQFCGNCGTPRSGDYGSPSLQSKVASLWEMQEALKKTSGASPENSVHNPDATQESASADIKSGAKPAIARPQTDAADLEPPVSAESSPLRVPIASLDEISAPVLTAVTEAGHSAEAAPAEEASVEEVEENDYVHGAEEETALALPGQPWSSAAAARNYLEELAGSNHPSPTARFLSARRGDIYLAIAVMVVAVVICWGIWSNHPVSATGNSTPAAQHKADPNADLSWFDHMLISLGLAEAPPPPESKGNPDAQVWVDLHTALYYCQGADLYGKTPKGKYTSQRDAQLDSFGPASGRPCD
jgi:putative methionine-R-sulfoxide reductase with GAF domain